GVSVAESDGGKLVLDYTVEKALGGSNPPLQVAMELARVSYNRTVDSVTVPGTEVLTLDLRTILGSAQVGGTLAMKEGDKTFEYVVGIDTQRLYKLTMDTGIQGRPFRRGDVNADGWPPNISDPIAILNFL